LGIGTTTTNSKKERPNEMWENGKNNNSPYLFSLFFSKRDTPYECMLKEFPIPISPLAGDPAL
jgi:hypothetical protein